MGVAMTIAELANRELDILTGQLAYLKLSVSSHNSEADREESDHSAYMTMIARHIEEWKRLMAEYGVAVRERQPDS
jgi:hypothetical protein